MKVLFTGDFHGDRKFVKEIANTVEKEKVDLVVFAGDLTYDKNLEGLLGPIINKGVKVAIIPGNWESEADIEFLEKVYKPNVINLHQKVNIIKDKNKKIGFLGIGGGNIGVFGLGESEIEKIVERNIDKLKEADVKIIVSHVPPSNTKASDLGFTDAGSIGLRKAIEKHKPDIVICAHVHENGGVIDYIDKTKIINVAKQKIILEL